MSMEPTVIFRLDSDSLVFSPGDHLAGEYWIEGLEFGAVKAIEASVLWYTEGKGEEDMAVHEFWQRSIDDGRPLFPAKPERFSTTLPQSPLSYDGSIVKIHWCVRVRVFPTRGKEILGEREFQLGNIPPTRHKFSAASLDDKS